jgi:predicted dehydrogenase
MSNNIRIGIIGAGGNTRSRHIPGFQAIEGVEVTVLANRSRESSQRVADEFGIRRIAESWEDIVSDPEVDAICIGTWPNLHAEATIAGLENCKHVLTEARMARNLEEAERMMAASRAHPDLVAQIVPSPMSLALDGTIIKMLKEGTLGELREIFQTHTGCQSVGADAPVTFRQDRALSGNNILTMGIMHEMTQRWIPGRPEWLLSDAMTYTTQRRNAETGAMQVVDVPDSVSILGRYASGLRLIYHFSGVESGESRKESRLNGSRGSLRIDLAKQKIYFAKGGSEEQELVEIDPDLQGGWRAEADFVDSIRVGAPVTLTGFEAGVEYMRFTDAVHRSLSDRAGRVVL